MRWNEQVFRAYQPPDAAIDDFLREWLTTRLTPAKSAAKLGRGWQRSYFVPQGHRVPELDRLHELLAEVTYLLDNWLPAARSISPAPRTRIPEAVAEKMRAKLLALTAAAAQPATVTPAPSRVTDPELV